jgi:hypothetical protein
MKSRAKDVKETDFLKRGWSVELGKKWGIVSQKVKPWIDRNLTKLTSFYPEM